MPSGFFKIIKNGIEQFVEIVDADARKEIKSLKDELEKFDNEVSNVKKDLSSVDSQLSESIDEISNYLYEYEPIEPYACEFGSVNTNGGNTNSGNTSYVRSAFVKVKKGMLVKASDGIYILVAEYSNPATSYFVTSRDFSTESYTIQNDGYARIAIKKVGGGTFDAATQEGFLEVLQIINAFVPVGEFNDHVLKYDELYEEVGNDELISGYSCSWGSISDSGGNTSSSDTKYIRSSFIWLTKGSLIEPADGIEMKIAEYYADKTTAFIKATQMLADKYRIDSDCYVRVAIHKTINTAFDEANQNEYVRVIRKHYQFASKEKVEQVANLCADRFDALNDVNNVLSMDDLRLHFVDIYDFTTGKTLNDFNKLESIGEQEVLSDSNGLYTLTTTSPRFAIIKKEQKRIVFPIASDSDNRLFILEYKNPLYYVNVVYHKNSSGNNHIFQVWVCENGNSTKYGDELVISTVNVNSFMLTATHGTLFISDDRGYVYTKSYPFWDTICTGVMFSGRSRMEKFCTPTLIASVADSVQKQIWKATDKNGFEDPYRLEYAKQNALPVTFERNNSVIVLTVNEADGTASNWSDSAPYHRTEFMRTGTALDLNRYGLNIQGKFECEYYLPTEKWNDATSKDVLMQLHANQTGISLSLQPEIEVFVRNGKMYLLTAYNAEKAEDAGATYNQNVREYEISDVIKDRWFRLDVRFRKAFDKAWCPYVEVRIDDKLICAAYDEVGYNIQGLSFVKFGIYEPSWASGGYIGNSRSVKIRNQIFTY